MVTLSAVLAARKPAAVVNEAWGAFPLEISAYTEPADLPDELVTSVRCIVDVGDRIVVCRDQSGRHHIWPGGRRDAGESIVQTAAREVHEETGWRIDPGTARAVGWLHLHHLSPRPDNHPYPHPDFLQIVLRANGVGDEPTAWTDTEGYVAESGLVTLDEARRFCAGDPICCAFIQ